MRPCHLIVGTANNNDEQINNENKQQTTYKEPLEGSETIISNEIREFKEPEVVESHDVPIESITPYVMMKEAEGIKRFLERPLEIATVQWTGSNSGQIQLNTFPVDLFDFKSIREKITHFRYFRAGVKITVLINGTSFHYGKLRMTWYPEATADTYLAPFDPQDHYVRANPVAQTGLRGIDMYPDGSNTYVLEAPYMKPIPYISLSDVFSPLSTQSPFLKKTIGTMAITVISPLVNLSNNPTNVDITIFAQFTDVKLEGPSVTDYSGTLPTNTFFFPLTDPTVITVFQTAREAKIKSERGVISSSLNEMAKVTSLFADIPEAAAATLALKGGETLATIMGFSRPNDQRQVGPMCIKIPDLSMTEGLQMGHRFTASAETRSDRISHMMDEQDENYIIKDLIQRPMLFKRYSIESTVAKSTNTIEIPVKPTMSDEYTSGTVKYLTLNNMAYIAKMFKFYRGSIRLQFEFICSNFQTQRFLLGFQPNDSFLSMTTENSGLIENRIFTVNGMHHEDFVVPWNSNKYLSTMDDTLGTVSLRTLTQQTSSNGITAPIYVNVYVSACPDMDFWGLTPPSGLIPYEVTPPVTVFQSANSTLANTVDFKTIGKSVIGESLQGLKQIISRPGYLTASLNNNEVLTFGTQSTSRGNPNFDSTQTLGSYMDYVRMLFRYCRGSNVITCLSISDPVEHKAVLQYGKQTDVFTINTTTTPDFEVWSTYGFNYYPDRSDLLPQFIVPYYSEVPFVPVSYSVNDNYDQLSGLLRIARTKGTTGVSYLQAAGDDYQLGCYLGAPTLAEFPLQDIVLN